MLQFFLKKQLIPPFSPSQPLKLLSQTFRLLSHSKMAERLASPSATACATLPSRRFSKHCGVGSPRRRGPSETGGGDRRTEGDRAETKPAVQRERLRWPRHLNNIVCEMEIVGSKVAAISTWVFSELVSRFFKVQRQFFSTSILTTELAESLPICDLCVSMFRGKML